jgi:hypothetical protein
MSVTLGNLVKNVSTVVEKLDKIQVSFHDTQKKIADITKMLSSSKETGVKSSHPESQQPSTPVKVSAYPVKTMGMDDLTDLQRIYVASCRALMDLQSPLRVSIAMLGEYCSIYCISHVF